MLGQKKITVPEWASTLGEANYPKFVKAIEDYFKRRKTAFVFGDGVAILSDDNFKCGLSNLVQLCAQATSKKYLSIVSRHFGALLKSRAFEKQFNEIAGDFEKVKQYLGVRLYDRQYATYKDNLTARPFTGELFLMLVWDFPAAIQNVRQSQLDKWDKTLDELFAIGRENIKNKYKLKKLKTTAYDIGEGDRIFFAGARHFFVGNLLLELDDHPEFIGKGGAICAVPTRDMAIIYPVRDLKVLTALNEFFFNVPKSYAKGPGSLTREVYWYRDGKFKVLNYENDNGNIKFTPSEAFLALLNDELT